jgi:hypothetical protein
MDPTKAPADRSPASSHARAAAAHESAAMQHLAASKAHETGDHTTGLAHAEKAAHASDVAHSCCQDARGKSKAAAY